LKPAIGMIEINYSQHSALSNNSQYSHLLETDISDNASNSLSGTSSNEFQINPQENVHLPLIGELCNWANIFQINQNALTSLLQVLSKHGHNDLSREHF